MSVDERRAIRHRAQAQSTIPASGTTQNAGSIMAVTESKPHSNPATASRLTARYWAIVASLGSEKRMEDG
jgi:hypothetical protein